jgi:hypothetical protein
MAPTRIPRWQRIGSRYLVAVRWAERRLGAVGAALLVALTAESIGIFFAASYYTSYQGRYTPLVPNPFGRAEPYGIGAGMEHRVRILGPCIAWVLVQRRREKVPN